MVGVAGRGRRGRRQRTAESQATHGGVAGNPRRVARRATGGGLTVEELTGRQARSEVPIRLSPYAPGVDREVLTFPNGAVAVHV